MEKEFEEIILNIGMLPDEKIIYCMKQAYNLAIQKCADIRPGYLTEQSILDLKL